MRRVALSLLLAGSLWGCTDPIAKCEEDGLCVNGTCEDPGGGSFYECVCDPGFQGNFCDEPVDTDTES